MALSLHSLMVRRSWGSKWAIGAFMYLHGINKMRLGLLVAALLPLMVPHALRLYRAFVTDMKIRRRSY